MLLCIIPKINPDAPTVGPAVLKATLEKAGYSCKVLDLNIRLFREFEKQATLRPAIAPKLLHTG